MLRPARVERAQLRHTPQLLSQDEQLRRRRSDLLEALARLTATHRAQSERIRFQLETLSDRRAENAALCREIRAARRRRQEGRPVTQVRVMSTIAPDGPAPSTTSGSTLT